MSSTIHIKVEASTVYYRQPDATDVFTSRNGYQWHGFTLTELGDVLRLRDELNKRIIELEDAHAAAFVESLMKTEGGHSQEE